MAQHENHAPEPKAKYSPVGTFIFISLFVFAFIVVPIKMFANASPKAGWVLLILGTILLISIIAAFVAPVKKRNERIEYAVRPPMELDPNTFDATKDGVSW